ncbi:ATP-binding cassette domain-containing protein [Kiritimatiellaeota bacterium B1221]|nr:ATP-binding cassette domain-containing protein [Kiritimatiellaeota bacterium B1221]
MKFHSWEALGGEAIVSRSGLIQAGMAVSPDLLQVRVECLLDKEATYILEHLLSESSINPKVDLLEFSGHNEVTGTPLLDLDGKYWRVNPQGIWEDVPPPVGIQVRDLSFSRGKRMILDSVQLSLGPGQLVGVMGPSGCGKSTFARCLLGDLEVSGGQINFLDESGARAADPVIGYVPQENLLYPYLTALESMTYLQKLRGSEDTETLHGDAREILQQLKLAGVIHTPVSQLSGGEAKRLNVAVELQQLPQILVLDEPTAGLDPRMQDELMDRLREIAHSGITVVCITHDLSLVRKLDHLLILRSLLDQADCSSVVFEGAPDKLEAQALLESYAADCRWSVESVPAEVLPAREPVRRSMAANRSRQLFTVSGRSWRRFVRNRNHVGMALCLPTVFSAMIVLSQLRPGNPGFASVLLFSTVALLWLSMNFGVREIVSEWSLYLRDKRSGLSPCSYILGKAFFVLQVAGLQVVLFIASFGVLAQMQPFGLQMSPFLLSLEMLKASWLPLLLLSGSGALAGLMISALCRSEALAVTLVPLMLIPHLLFNRVGYHGSSTLENQAHLYGPAPEGFSLEALREVDPEMNGLEFWIHSVGSGGLISRPTLNLLVYGGKGKPAPVTEYVYVGWLCFLQASLTIGLFLWVSEKRQAGAVDHG